MYVCIKKLINFPKFLHTKHHSWQNNAVLRAKCSPRATGWAGVI